MSEYTLTAPLVIGPRLMPAVIVGMDTDTYGTVSAEIDHYDGERYVLRYVIDTPGETYENIDVRSATTPIIDGDHSDLLRELFRALLSFLGHEADVYGAWMCGSDARPSDGWAFSQGIAEWAYLNADEISEAVWSLEDIADRGDF